jgi:hypothetical protein
MGPGSLSAFTRVFDALWAGTTETAIPSHARNAGAAVADFAEFIIGRRFAPTRWLHPAYCVALFSSVNANPGLLTWIRLQSALRVRSAISLTRGCLSVT